MSWKFVVPTYLLTYNVAIKGGLFGEAFVRWDFCPGGLFSGKGQCPTFAWPIFNIASINIGLVVPHTIIPIDKMDKINEF